MTKTPRRTVIRPTGKCIFCEGGAVPGNPMTREHIWSDWMAAHLPGGQNDSYYEIMQNIAGKAFENVTATERFRAGAAKSKKIKAVCKECNSGWMSDMETAVKPILLPLLHGDSILLSEENRRVLSEWIVLKALVCEHNSTPQAPADPIFDRAARTAFMETRAIPNYFEIWIGMHDGTKWKSAIFRNSTGIVPDGVPLPADMQKNLYTLTLGIGHFLVYVFATTTYEMSLLDHSTITPPMLKLWPLGKTDIRWRPFYIVGDDYAEHLASAVDRLLRSPNTIRAPGEAT